VPTTFEIGIDDARAGGEAIMSTRQNKEIVKQLLEAHVRSDPSRAAEILSPKLVWHMAGESRTMGRDDYVEGLKTGARAFSDVSCDFRQIIGEDDSVAALVTWRMRHTGPFLDLDPTNREVEFNSLWYYRIVDARVVEIWGFDEDFTAKLRSE
jgi:C-1 hydroxylase